MRESTIKIVDRYHRDQTRLMDILIDVQAGHGYISDADVETIAGTLGLNKVEVEQTVSFYHFFSDKPVGRYAIYLNNSAVACMMGRDKIKRTLEQEVGIPFNSVSPDGLIGLWDTACIGMNDQEPAAIINNIIFTNLTPFRVRRLVKDIKAGKSVHDLFIESYGDSQNSSELVRSMVFNNIRIKGPVLDSTYAYGSALKKVVDLKPEQVIEMVKESVIRGRGGAGFPTGLKWELCRSAKGDKHWIFCNADEGEPGTFKDRVILTERPRLLFEGMAIAGYAVGSTEGILYVRYEYKYLERYLHTVLHEMKAKKMLGKNIMDKPGFDFDIRIQFGGGAYVCGEESALIESAEGKRGEPRDRPPYPVSSGYLNQPTVVNNVETLCSVVKIIENGPQWYRELGTRQSTGTKILCVSGDCKYPGVYEIEWGFTVGNVLEMVGAENVQAVQVGGPSGSCVGPDEFERILGYEDLATGGSLIVIGKHRDLIADIVVNFTDFFIEESCGSCVPCRALTPIYRQWLSKLLAGKSTKKELYQMQDWATVMRFNRCGLGHTALNPFLTTIKNFEHLYLDKVCADCDFVSEFNMEEAVAASCQAAGRTPNLEAEHE